MEYKERGKIEHRNRARQINNFENLQYGNITPTDIDGCFDYHQKAFVFIECKYGNAQMPNGQRKCFESLCNILNSAGYKAVLIVAEHNVANCDNDVDVANAICRKFFYKNQWYNNGKDTVKKICDEFMKSLSDYPF